VTANQGGSAAKRRYEAALNRPLSACIHDAGWPRVGTGVLEQFVYGPYAPAGFLSDRDGAATDGA
jgi:hypothetical protein